MAQGYVGGERFRFGRDPLSDSDVAQVETKRTGYQRGASLWWVNLFGPSVSWWQSPSHRPSGVDTNHSTVSQFTLLASTKKGSKPTFHKAMAGDQAKELYDYFYARLEDGYSADKVRNGVFQAMMEVGLVNDGPVRRPLGP